MASGNIIRQVPRLLGPQLNKMGKFPAAIRPNEKIEDKIAPMAREVKVSLKFKVRMPMSLSCAVANVDMDEKEIIENITAIINFILTLMKKGWQNIKKVNKIFFIYLFILQICLLFCFFFLLMLRFILKQQWDHPE